MNREQADGVRPERHLILLLPPCKQLFISVPLILSTKKMTVKALLAF
jgi:hypothetical protein